MSSGTGGGGSEGAAIRGRKIYKIGTHKIKTKDEQGQSRYEEVPILTRALARVGQRLNLDEATEQDIKTTVRYEGGEAEFFKRGACFADRILIIYEEAGEGGEVKIRQIQLPIPSWAPNYRIVRNLASKAASAGLRLRGLRRHGFLIQPPASGGGGGGGEGGGGGGSGG